MQIKKLTLKSKEYPPILKQFQGMPSVLYQAGAPLPELLKRPSVAIVGSRNISVYGRRVTEQFAKELAEQGIVIISGLALGVDATAQQAALEAGGYCIAVLPCPIDKIVPAANQRLAEGIVKSGGALVSEYPPGDTPFKQNFIVRNRIVSALAQGVLITEAGATSGTRHTVRFADEQNKSVYAVPGNITNIGSVGSNNYIKNNLAKLVTEPNDILDGLNLPRHQTHARQVKGSNANEQKILDLMLEGFTAGDELLRRSGLKTELYNHALTMLEISGKVRPLGMDNWAID